ncbi:MAG: hypothetical protein Ct9H300mP13_7460 [Gammaproteobacteria bacterium]|nr:MAG: hypothetical protein Ct9H300mP13_7460 [Gammaproteobacteria bacterium]
MDRKTSAGNIDSVPSDLAALSERGSSSVSESVIVTDQTVLFLILGAVFGFLLWGRVRYDLVAFGALVVAVIAGAVPSGVAFSGFGHPATVIVALVLIVAVGCRILAQSNFLLVMWSAVRVLCCAYRINVWRWGSSFGGDEQCGGIGVANAH